jgi:2',3'-cyclic-nucleotide 2'-phosphodiesterase (5'-nucleotidase family)
MARRATVIEQNKAESNFLLLVDAGGFSRGMGEISNLKTEYLLKMMLEMEYAAINIGYRDLTAGIDFLDSLRQSYPNTLVSGNIVNAETRDSIFDPYKIVTLDAVNSHHVPYNKLKIGIIGLTDTLNYSHYRNNSSIIPDIEDPVPLAKELVNKLSRRVDLLVLLFYGKYQTLSTIIESCPQIDVAVMGAEYYRAMKSAADETPLVTATQALGKYADFVEIGLDKNRNIITQDITKIAIRDSVKLNPRIASLKEEYQTKARELADNRNR